MSYDIARKEDFWDPFLKWTNAIANVSFFLLYAPAGWSAVSRAIIFQRARVMLYDTVWRRGHSDNQRRRAHYIYDYICVLPTFDSSSLNGWSVDMRPTVPSSKNGNSIFHVTR